jgi:hypothetical protein
MKIIIRLVGFSEIINDEKVVYDLILSSNIFNYNFFENYLISKYKRTDTIFQSEEFVEAQCNNFKKELLECSLTCNSKNLKKETIIDNTETIYKVFLFTANNDIKKKLINIFKENGVISPFLIIKKSENDEKKNDEESENDIESETKNDEDSETNNDKETMSDNESLYENNLNNKEIDISIENYNDKDFITLLKIYKNKPQLFNLLYKLLSTDKTIPNIKTKSDENLQNKICEIIKEIIPNISNDDINNILDNSGLNINLAIRQLIHI